MAKPRSSDEIIAAGPSDDEGDISKPLGVPSGYSAPFSDEMLNRPRYLWGQGTQPRYFQGSEWLPSAMSVERIAELQMRMVKAGVFEPGTRFRLGAWDSKSRTAWKEVLSLANASGITDQESLRRFGQSRYSEAGIGIARPIGEFASGKGIQYDVGGLGGLGDVTEGRAKRPRLSIATPPDIEAGTYMGGR